MKKDCQCLQLKQNVAIPNPHFYLVFGNWAGPVEPSQVQKSFLVPHFLSARKRLQSSRPSLRSKGPIQTVTDQGSEEMQKQKKSSLKHFVQDFPSGPVAKNLPANAGDMDSIPDLGRSPCCRAAKPVAPQLLSLCAATAEVCTPQSPCSATREATTTRSQCIAARE